PAASLNLLYYTIDTAKDSLRAAPEICVNFFRSGAPPTAAPGFSKRFASQPDRLFQLNESLIKSAYEPAPAHGAEKLSRDEAEKTVAAIWESILKEHPELTSAYRRFGSGPTTSETQRDVCELFLLFVEALRTLPPGHDAEVYAYLGGAGAH
ncbi:MAG: hypothetical protein KDD44_11655, partial [Bdellovibrionales bacterium]|nr:hypothetical protein [Bdellovibrionales bacterium]